MRSSLIPSLSELLLFASSNQDTEFRTLIQDKRFHVRVDGDELFIRPSGGEERHARAHRVSQVLAKLQETGSWKPGDYSGDSFNASYLLPLVQAWQALGQAPTDSRALGHFRQVLTEEQREALKAAVRLAVGPRDCRLREDRLRHGFRIHLRSAVKNGWIGSVYWSQNNLDNDVEIAFDLPRMAMMSDELNPLARWFQGAAQELQHGQARNHSGGHLDWFRAGFRLADALRFFTLLAEQTNLLASERWKLEKHAKPLAARLGIELQSLENQESASIARMLAMARQACSQSGEIRTAITKVKEFKFFDDTDFQRHVAQLLVQQKNLCAITGLPLQFVGCCEDEELMASLDRIDSDGHYASGNLQVVCHFINRWKSDDADKNVRRLIALLRA